MTEFTLGARVSCSDGFCGEVIRTILDPATRVVTHLVIEPKHRKMDGRLVPLELVDATGDEIRLRCNLARFEQLEPAEEVDLAGGVDYSGGYGQAEAVPGYGNVAGMGVGMGVGMGPGQWTPTVLSHAVPLGDTEVERHESVHAVDGEIGRVEGFVVDPADNKVTHVLLQQGHMWGRKEVAIPVSAVVSVDAGIRLNITKQQVEDLPPVNPGHS
jgi:sporulation protein YlmC with PRC-barrel domain